MAKLFMCNGHQIEVEDFKPTNKNCIKVNIHIDGNDSEGVWACIPDKTLEAYSKDEHSYYVHYATLRNAPIMFFPRNVWGLIIPIKLNGTKRPECDIALVDFEKTILENPNCNNGGLFNYQEIEEIEL